MSHTVLEVISIDKKTRIQAHTKMQVMYTKNGRNSCNILFTAQ